MVSVGDANSGHGGHGAGRLTITAEEDNTHDCLFVPLFSSRFSGDFFPFDLILWVVEEFVVVMLQAMGAGMKQRAATGRRQDEQGEGGKVTIVEKR